MKGCETRSFDEKADMVYVGKQKRYIEHALFPPAHIEQYKN
jgi:hypothetical protein